MDVLHLHYIFGSLQAPVAVTTKYPQNPYPAHAHDVDEIVVVLSGNGMHTLNGESFHACRGDVFYVRAGDWHQFDDLAGLNLINVLCCCTTPLPQTVLPAYDYLKRIPGHWSLRPGMLEQVEPMLRRLERECLTQNHTSTYMIEHQFSSLLAHLWCGRDRQEQGAQARSPILALMDYCNTHFAAPLQLDELAHKFARSERSLNRLFKGHTGLSPMHYLVQVRLCKAIELLRATNLPVTDVAYRCGFNDSNYFATCFKKKFSISPSVFHRQAIQQGLTA